MLMFLRYLWFYFEVAIAYLCTPFAWLIYSWERYDKMITERRLWHILRRSKWNYAIDRDDLEFSIDEIRLYPTYNYVWGVREYRLDNDGQTFDGLTIGWLYFETYARCHAGRAALKEKRRRKQQAKLMQAQQELSATRANNQRAIEHANRYAKL